MLPDQWFLALHRSPGPRASGPGTWTCVGGMRNCADSPRKESVFVLIFGAPVIPNPGQTLCHSPSPTRCGFGLGAGRGGCRQQHSVHSCLLTAPGTTAGSPGCPKIPADSSVGEQGQDEGMGGISGALPLFRSPIQRGSGAGHGDGQDSGCVCLSEAPVSLEVPRGGDRCSTVSRVGAWARPLDAWIGVLAPSLLPWQPSRTSPSLSVFDRKRADDGSNFMRSGEDEARECG